MTNSNSARLATFRALHAPGELLVLPNAWDAGSAALIESCGARAIATTSAAVAWSHGFPDGENLPFDTLLRTVGEILRVVKVPVTVDSEKGFSNEPAKVAESVLQLVELGAVGINLEDGNDGTDLLVAKIEAIKNATSRAGADVFINARTDVLLKKLVPAEQAVSEILSRAERYARAGADGFFVPLLAEPDMIRKITGSVTLPVNVMAIPPLAPVAELRKLGVRRLSGGGSVGSYAFAAVQELVERFLAEGNPAALFATAGKPRAMNALLKDR